MDDGEYGSCAADYPGVGVILRWPGEGALGSQYDAVHHECHRYCHHFVDFIGYSMNYFGAAEPGWFAGNPFKDFGLLSTPLDDYITISFGVIFAMIATALISGAIADLVGLGSWMLFAAIWASLVYFPVVSWIWGNDWIAKLGLWLGTPEVIDLTGGTAIHINAGVVAFTLAIMAGKRKNFSPVPAAHTVCRWLPSARHCYGSAGLALMPARQRKRERPG